MLAGFIGASLVRNIWLFLEELHSKEKGLAVGGLRGLITCGGQRQNRTADTRVFGWADGDKDYDVKGLQGR